MLPGSVISRKVWGELHTAHRQPTHPAARARLCLLDTAGRAAGRKGAPPVERGVGNRLVAVEERLVGGGDAVGRGQVHGRRCPHRGGELGGPARYLPRCLLRCLLRRLRRSLHRIHPVNAQMRRPAAAARNLRLMRGRPAANIRILRPSPLPIRQ